MAMVMTNAAHRWLEALWWCTPEVLEPIIDRAEEIAREMGATRLGRAHLEAALEEIAPDSPYCEPLT